MIEVGEQPEPRVPVGEKLERVGGAARDGLEVQHQAAHADRRQGQLRGAADRGRELIVGAEAGGALGCGVGVGQRILALRLPSQTERLKQ